MTALPEHLANLREQGRLQLRDRYEQAQADRAQQLELLRAWIHDHIGKDIRQFLDWDDLNDRYITNAAETVLTLRFPESWPIELRIAPSIDHGWHTLPWREHPEDGPGWPVYRIVRWGHDLERQEVLYAVGLGCALVLAELTAEEREQFGAAPY